MRIASTLLAAALAVSTGSASLAGDLGGPVVEPEVIIVADEEDDDMVGMGSLGSLGFAGALGGTTGAAVVFGTLAVAAAVAAASDS